jgi:hypothetical protein
MGSVAQKFAPFPTTNLVITVVRVKDAAKVGAFGKSDRPVILSLAHTNQTQNTIVQKNLQAEMEPKVQICSKS